jgi:hypothetical protein
MVRTFSLALALSLGASAALANDTTAELKTGGLEFTRSAEITMMAEKLYISPKQVRVDYVYRNTTDKDVETYVAFPMPDITGSGDPMMDAGDTSKDNFLGFSVTQDDVAINPLLQQKIYAADLDVTDVLAAAKIPFNPLGDQTREALGKQPKATIADLETRGMLFANTYDDGNGEKTEFIPTWTLKSVYWWKTTFPAGKDIRVSHTYHPSVGGTVATTYLDNNKPQGERYDEYKRKYCIDDSMVKIAQKSNALMAAEKPYYYEQWISYVLTTGANWNGPISKFTLIVDKGNARNYVSFCGTGIKKTGPTTFEMNATDFSPEKDLDILLLVPSDLEQ